MSVRPPSTSIPPIHPWTTRSRPRAPRPPVSRNISVERKKKRQLNNQTFEVSEKKRSCSVERAKQPEYSPYSRCNLRSTSKLVTGHPGPGELEEVLGQKKELLALLGRGTEQMKQQDYEEAVKCFKMVLKEELSPEALYKKALCLVHLKQQRLAVPDLMTLIRDFPGYSKEAYSVAATCFVALGDPVAATRQLSKGLAQFPRFFEGFLARGQLHNQEQKWDKAIADFYKAIELRPGEGASYLGLADSLLSIGDKRSALKVLGQAVNCRNTAPESLIKRASVLFRMKEHEAALLDIEKSLKLLHANPEAWYYKAMIYFAQDNAAEAVLALEQVIKYDSDRKFTGSAIYNLGTIKIKQRDYYGALYTFKRAADNCVEIPEQRVLKSYVEAVLLLIKRHFPEGIAALSKIIRKKHPLLTDYMGKCYAYRAFGHSSTGNHKRALKDYTCANKLGGLDAASEYNFLTSQAIVLAEKDLKSPLSAFQKAAVLFPMAIEPLTYQAAMHFTLGVQLSDNKLVTEAYDLLTKAIDSREGESDLHFFRGLLSFYLGKSVEAVPDLEIAVDKAEDNVPAHFLLKGLCYASLGFYKEAIQEFSIVLQLDETVTDAYLYRGRCLFLLKDTESAFMDYQKIIVAKPQDSLVHIYAGDLLVLIGSLEDAVKAYSNANATQESALAYTAKANALLLQKDLKSAISALNSARALEDSPELEFDLIVLEALASANNKEKLNYSLAAGVHSLNKAQRLCTEGRICKSKHMHCYKGVFLLLLGEFSKAKEEFKAATSERDMLNFVKSSDYIDTENAEILYNIALCSVMQEHYESALMELHELLYVLEREDKGKLLLLMGLLQLGLGQNAEAKELVTEAFKYAPELVSGYLEEEREIKILLMSASSKYAGTYPMARVLIGNCRPVLLRPAFSLPTAPLPELNFNCDSDVTQLFSVKSVKCRPEAPWLNRVKGALQFTEEIQEVLDEALSDTESSAEESEEEEENDSEEDVGRRGCSSTGNLRLKEDSNSERGGATANLFDPVMRRRGNQFACELDSSDEDIRVLEF